MNLVESWRPNNKRDLHPLVHLDSPARNPGGSHTGPCGVERTFLKRGVPQLMTPSRWLRSREKLGELFSPQTAHVVGLEKSRSFFTILSNNQDSQRGWGKLWNLSGMLLQEMKGRCSRFMIILPQALEATRVAAPGRWESRMLISGAAKLSYCRHSP